MTIAEFSDLFDTLVSSYRRFKALDKQEILDSIEFNEYEKSVFLTLAQEDIVRELYAGKYSTTAFERTEEERRYLDKLVDQKEYLLFETTPVLPPANDKFKHYVYTLPENCWYIVYEQVTWDPEGNECLGGKVVDVVPTTHDEYWRTRNNPFRGPNAKRVLRLDKGNTLVELISSNKILNYTIRYLKLPKPIVLAYLPNESVLGVTEPLGCELHEALHNDILDRAVRIALSTKINSKEEKKGKD